MRPATASGTAHPDLHTQLYWESTGEGEPVLLVMGLGLSGGAWWRTVDTLSQRFRVITFDNRGVGRSRGLTPAYTTEALADDAVAVLDALAIEQANIYGLSLGGMVAQQIALRHPRRVRSLVLGATTPGGRKAKLADEEVMNFFSTRGNLSREEAAWASVAYNYSRRCRDEHSDRIAEDIRRRLEYEFDEAAYQAQMMAAAMHNCTSRLGRIGMPALVIHGEEDRVVPVANAHLIASRLPQGRLHLLEGAGHLYTTEAPEADAEVARFFEAVG
ncbi:alpha/beta fold hydrolase [Solirubrobacter soli]|uniref:alpha/beta fold hydrolase n=1 Tax=Solirubrobacter soli TaxID=363832 RepID=UPI000411ECF0|nr:alpha/beta hydrolase [Solirubrobacter soli]